MNQSAFWAKFHAAWGKDKESGREYDKKAWMYVQAKMEQYLGRGRVDSTEGEKQ